MKPLKATRDQIRQHNRRLLLRAIYGGLADNRAALSVETGLAKPTVSDLIGELIADGLLAESGRGESTDSGGKPPTLLRFLPDSRQVIGVSLDNGRAFGVLSNLAGDIIAQHYADLEGATGDAVGDLLSGVINGLIAQLDAPLLCIGVGIPGVVDSNGFVRNSSALGWKDYPLLEPLSRQYAVPIYVGSSAELTALAQYAFGIDSTDTRSLVTILVTDSVEIGITLDDMNYHQGSDLSALRASALSQGQCLDTRLGWSAVRKRIDELRARYPQTTLPHDGVTYVELQYSARTGDPAAQQIYEELADQLAEIIAWIVTLIRPDHVTLAGSIVNLGSDFIDYVTAKTETLICTTIRDSVTFSLAYAPNLSAIGAAALALQRELSIL